MSKYKVYNKSGNIERCTLSKVEYNGSFMDSRVVNATVESNKPINFDIYDYITYRGEKFELDYKPTSSKSASTGSVGNAYVYELTFVSLKYELERCEMRDLVPYDNGIVYPTPITIEFTGTAEKLAERIQACLDELYTGSQKWTITVVSGASDEEKNISISQANCWSAVSLFNTEYGLDFYISDRTITVGSTGTAIDFTFQYGKGKGLYKIERTSDTDQGIVTRLRAYGGTRNIGDNYLRDKTEWPNSTLPASMYLPNLMLPGFEETEIDYIEADNIEEYGIREGSVVYEDIYPSIVGTTNSKGQRIDRIQSAESITDDTASEFWITTYDLEFEKPLGDYIVTGGIPTIYIRTGQLQGYSFEINTSKIEEQEDGGYKLYLSRNTDNGFTVPNKDVNLAAGTEFVFIGIAMPKSYIEAAEDRLLARAEEYLAKYSQTNYGYEIGLDEIFAARNPSIYNTLYEGKKLRVVDADLGIDEEITIQSLSITEEDGSIPVYRITLNNEVSASTLNRIQGQVSQLESTVTNGFTLLQWQTQQYIRRSMRPYALWTRDGTTIWLSIDNEKSIATLDYATLKVTKDIVCYAVDEEIEDVEFPIASYTQKGILSVASGTGLVIEDGVLSINPDLIGGGGIDTEQLAAYLTQNNYVNQQWLVDNGYLKLTSPLTGYVKPGTYSPLTAEDTLIGAIGKLEANFGNYVDLTTDQTIGGNKTFNNLIVGKDDVVCYAVGDVEDVAFPLASYTQKGILSVQQGTGLLVSNGVLSLDPDYAGGGGVNFTPGTALELTSGGTLNVKIGTTSGTVCAGNDTRLTTAYNNSHTHSNKSVLDGITSGYVSNWNTAYNLSHSHSNKSVLDGISSSDVSNWGTAYNNAHWHSNKSYLDVINQDLSNSDSPRFADLTLRTSGPTLSFYNTSDTMLYWRIIYPGTSNLEIHRQTTRVMSITGSGDLIAVGDVVAYSNSSSVSDISAVATTSTYGLVKYDGSTIGKNSSGQLYVINGGGGSSGTVYWENISGKPSWIGSSKPSYSWSEIGSKPNVLSTVSTSGSGNVVTGVSYNGSTVTVTKGNVSGGGSNVVWSATTNNTATLSVDGAAKQLPLATGFSVNEYTSYAAIKIVGYSLNVSLNGHTHSWSSITGKPSIISSISVSRSGSGNAVGSLSVSGSTIYYNMTNISTSSSGSWNGGTVTNNITISRSGATLLLQNGSYKWDFRNAGNTLYLEKNGTPHLYVMGANWTLNSDERIKDIGEPVEDILDKLSGLRVVHFKYKNRLGLGKQVGVIAQDIQRVFPEAVSRGAYDETVGDYILGVDYSTLGAVVAIAGLKELYTRFRPVENKVKVLESKVRNLQARLDNAYREIFNLKEGKETA